MIILTIQQASNGWIVSASRSPENEARVIFQTPVQSVFKTVEEIQTALPTLMAEYFVATPTVASTPETDTVNPPAPGT